MKLQMTTGLSQYLRSELIHASNYLGSYGIRDVQLDQVLQRLGNALIAETVPYIYSTGNVSNAQERKHMEENDVQVMKTYLDSLGKNDNDGKVIRSWIDFSKLQPRYKIQVPHIPARQQLQYTQFTDKKDNLRKDGSELVMENLKNQHENLEALRGFIRFISNHCIRREDYAQEIEFLTNRIYERQLFIDRERLSMAILRGDANELNMLRQEQYAKLTRYSKAHLFSTTGNYGSSGFETQLQSEIQRRMLSPIGESTAMDQETPDAVNDLLNLG